jgi:hypothetical protein
LLSDILPEAHRIDLIDLDVQGEELKVIVSSIEELDRQVARHRVRGRRPKLDQSETGLGFLES